MSNKSDKYLSVALDEHLRMCGKIGGTPDDLFLAMLLNDRDLDAWKIRKNLHRLTNNENRRIEIDRDLERYINRFNKWEIELVQLSYIMCEADNEAKNWLTEKTNKKDIKRIITQSSKLSALIENLSPFTFPNAHHFFTDDAVPEEMNPILDGYYFEDDGYKSLPEVLRNFVKYNEWLIKNHDTDKSFKNTEGIEQRLTAYHLHKYFITNFGKPEDETVAACISLMYPEKDSTATAEHIRKWTGRK